LDIEQISEATLRHDTFVFSIVESGDMVADFISGEDVVGLSSTGVAFNFVNDVPFTNFSGELRYVNGLLMGDVDGDGSADLSIDLNDETFSASDLVL